MVFQLLLISYGYSLLEVYGLKKFQEIKFGIVYNLKKILIKNKISKTIKLYLIFRIYYNQKIHLKKMDNTKETL